MITLGFACGISGPVTLDTAFTDGSGTPITSTYIGIPTGSGEGGIVYVNSIGVTKWWPFAYIGYNPIAASKILTSATVDGTPRTTTATNLFFAGSYKG